MSPDGKQIAFLSTCGGKPQIYLIPVDGGEARAFGPGGHLTDRVRCCAESIEKGFASVEDIQQIREVKC